MKVHKCMPATSPHKSLFFPIFNVKFWCNKRTISSAMCYHHLSMFVGEPMVWSSKVSLIFERPSGVAFTATMKVQAHISPEEPMACFFISQFFGIEIIRLIDFDELTKLSMPKCFTSRILFFLPINLDLTTAQYFIMKWLSTFFKTEPLIIMTLGMSVCDQWWFSVVPASILIG